MSDHAIQQRFAFCESGTCGRTIRLRSFTGDQWYNISLDDKTCDCLGFTPARGCEHLNALGIHRLRPFTPTTHPTFSQALSGLVKSLRIRRPEEAATGFITCIGSAKTSSNASAWQGGCCKVLLKMVCPFLSWRSTSAASECCRKRTST